MEKFSDLASLLQGAPKELLDTVRVTAIVRQTATLLGATPADRLRVNAVHALRGMRKKGGLSMEKRGDAGSSGLGAMWRQVRVWVWVEVLQLVGWAGEVAAWVAGMLEPG